MIKFALGFVFLASLISCGKDSNNSRNNYRQAPNYNYNHYDYNKHDYYKYKGKQYNYNWNNYNNQWLSVQGQADIAYCGQAYYTSNGLCAQSCMQRTWQPYVGAQTGYIWSCTYAGCGWHLVTQTRTWYNYQWTPIYRTAVCY